MHLKQQQLKATHQQIHVKQLKREEEATVVQTRLEAITEALHWDEFDNISAAGLPTPVEKVEMLLSRSATSLPPSILSGQY